MNDKVSATTLRNLDTTGAVTLQAWGASLGTLTAEASAAGATEAKADGSAPAGQSSDVDSTVTSSLTGAQSEQGSAGVGDADQQQATDSAVSDGDQRSASTSEGKVTVAAAVAVNVQTSSATAGVPDAVTITTPGLLTISTDNNTDGQATATGSAVGGDSPAKVGIGAAVAVNVVHVTNDATLGVASHQVGGLTLSALKLDVARLVAADPTDPAEARSDTYLASATSGAGGSSVGIAGSLALNLIDTESTALVAGGAHLALSGSGAVMLSSDDETDTTATAAPDTAGAAGGKIGVGASVALNIIANRSLARIGDDATLTGAGDLTLSASAIHAITTSAEAGATGGVALTPVVALAMVNNTTTAELGVLTGGGTQTSTGLISVSAAQQARETTSASAKAAGGKAAIGAALALNLVNDSVTATTHRNLTAGGDVSFRALGASLGSLTATASAAGAAPADDAGDAPAGDAPTVDSKVDGEFGSAGDRQSSANVGSAEQKSDTSTAESGNHSAESSQGKVTVAAAVGVNIQNSTVTAAVPDGISILSPTGALTIQAANNTDGQITADASAVGEEATLAQVGIGAAVAVNVVHVTNDATLGTATDDVGSIDISALKLDVAALMANPASTATRADSYLASATSGAGGSKVGIAGSLGLNLIDTESVASIADSADVTVHGAVALTADNQTGEVAKALPVEGTTGGTVGIGASVAINIVANRSEATIGSDVSLLGTTDLTLRATADHEIETEAEAGASGGVGIVPVLALAMVNNSTSATLQANPNTLFVSGDATFEAEQSATETTSASAKAAGSKAAVGAALALALVSDDVTTTTNRAIHAGGDVSFAATGASAGTLTVTAGASGAEGADSNDQAQDGGGSSVDDKVTNQFSFGKTEQSSSKVGDSKQQQDTATAEGQDHSAKSSEGKLSVAAAIGVNVVTSSVTAALPDAIDITAGGSLSVRSVNATDGTVTADASAAGAKVSIGAAAAVNAITETNTASLGAATYSANGVTVSALKGDPAGPAHVDSFTTSAKSGAGGTNVGIAGALALNLIDATSAATVSGSAIVNAGTGASSIAADQEMLASASATPLDDSTTSGGKVGIGASVALNLITTTSSAEIQDGAVFDNGAGLSVKANSAISTETEAEAGSEGGIAIDAVVALATLDETTTARIGTGHAIDTAGAVEIEATSSGENTATGTGEAKGGSVGVGAAVAVIVGAGAQATDLKNTSITQASLNRDLTADDLTINAESERTYEAYATASAGGGKDEDPSQTKDASSTKTLDSTKNYQKGTDKGGKVSVAAAVGVAAAQDQVTASLAGVNVSLTGDLTVSARNAADIATMGSGAATNPNAKVGVGVGVALSISNDSAVASIADGAVVSKAGDVNVTATSTQNMDQEPGKTDFLNGLGALAYAGAQSNKVSVAGALAVDISSLNTSASIGDNVTIGGSSAVGAVNVSADNSSRLATKAASTSTSTGNVGIGASVAVVSSTNTYQANIGAGSHVDADLVSVTATNEKVKQSQHLRLHRPGLAGNRDQDQATLRRGQLLRRGDRWRGLEQGRGRRLLRGHGFLRHRPCRDRRQPDLGQHGGDHDPFRRRRHRRRAERIRRQGALRRALLRWQRRRRRRQLGHHLERLDQERARPQRRHHPCDGCRDHGESLSNHRRLRRQRRGRRRGWRGRRCNRHHLAKRCRGADRAGRQRDCHRRPHTLGPEQL